MSAIEERINELRKKRPLTTEEQQELWELIRESMLTRSSLSEYRPSRLSAIHWWMAERDNRGVNHRALKVLDMFFDTLAALHHPLQQVPPQWSPAQKLGYTSGGKYGIIYQFPITSTEQATLRSCLNLAGEARSLLLTLQKMELLELNPLVAQAFQEADRFLSVRNFFTHIDERLADPVKHGVSGEAEIPCGISYTKDAECNFHLVLSGNTVYFTNSKNSLEADVSRAAFEAIFDKAEIIYNEVTSHKLHAETYPPYRSTLT